MTVDDKGEAVKFKCVSVWTIALFLTLTSAERAHAWGQYGHQQVNDAAMTLLGEKHPLGGCLNKNTYLIKRLSITPDMEWKGMAHLRDLSREDNDKRVQNDKEEHPLHFFERDAYFSTGQQMLSVANGQFTDIFPALKQLLSKNAQAVMKADPSKPIVDPTNPSFKDVADHGSSPWRIKQLYQLGVEALKGGDTQLALHYLGTLGHYVGDMSMPFHTTLNYDGKGSTPPLRGIHEAIDTLDLPTKGKDAHSVYPSFETTRVPVLSMAQKQWEANRTNPLTEAKIITEVFQLIDSGFPKINELLEVYAKYSSMTDERSAPSESGGSRNRRPDLTPSTRHTRNQVKHMPADLMRKFSQEVILTVDDRLGASSALLARLWEAAYRQAGKPSLETCEEIEFNQSYAIQNYPSPSQYLRVN
jgi:hypothetical protein